MFAGRWLDRLTGRRSSREEDLSRELRAHLDLEIEERQDGGLSASEAHRTAATLIGNPTLVKEEVRNMSPFAWSDRLLQDLRYGFRGFRRSPSFFATAVLSLALGIGANTAIFSVINAAMMRPLPVSRPEELALLTNGDIGNFSYPTYRALRDGNRTFAHVIAASSTQKVPVGVGADTEQVFTKMVSGNYFSGLDVTPAAGRMLTSADELEPVAVISHGYWLRRFGGAPTVVGQPIKVNGAPLTVVGVARARFFGEAPGESPDVWTSLALQPQNSRDERGFTWLYLIGRLKPGATIPQARADLSALRAQIQPSAPSDTPFKEVEVGSGAQGSSALRSRIAAPLMVLMTASGLVLIIACLNLGGLLLTRGAARESEIAMRLAIGATGGRIVRQLMTESLLLAAIGGALGLGFAFWGSRTLVSLVASLGAGVTLDTGLDGSVLLFTAAVSMVAAVLFGLAPALRSVGRGRRHTLMATQRVVGRERRWGLRDSFVVVQVALSLVLLASATMFIRTLRNLETQDLGFNADNRLIVSVLREQGYRPNLPTLVPRLLERVGAVPGVATASLAMFGTLSPNGGGVNGLRFDGYTSNDPQDLRARANWIGPNYFRTTGIQLVAGRDVLPSDDAASRKVAVINETTARHFFANQDAVGKHFVFNKDDYEIVGVTRDAKYSDIRETALRVIYFPLLQGGSGFSVLEVRTSRGEPAAVATAIRAAITDVDPRLSAGESLPVTAQIDRRLTPERLVANLTGFFGGLTLLLVSIGIYGTLAFTAARRTKEIGVRLALGSDRGAVIRIVLGGVAGMLTAGLVVGALGVFAVGRLVGSLLFHLEPMDPVTMLIAIGLLLAVALSAGALPAIRASRMDPARILRE